MRVSDSLKDKVVIIAEHDDAFAEQIGAMLTHHGFSDVRHANSGEQIYEVLKSLRDQSEKIGLLIINENLPKCRLADMQRELSDPAAEFAIPFLILGAGVRYESKADCNQSLPTSESWLTHRLAYPPDLQELQLASTLLLKLRQERLFNNAQKERLVHELSESNIRDAKLKYLIAHDELTGLFNRSQFERELKLALNLGQKLQKNASLIFVEVDHFGMINACEGFDVGDHLLVELSTLIRKLAPAKNLFARVGVNEFCIFFEDIDNSKLQRFAESLNTTVESYRFSANGAGHNLSVSMGIATLSDIQSVEHPGKLILFARQACRLCKLNGEKIGIYSAQDKAIKDWQDDIRWAPIIQDALRQKRFFLVFQPVIQLNDGAISHYEVLLRMRYEDETILPSFFIPIAERTGLIQAIDLWVIDNTIDFLAALPSHRSYVSVAIKLSDSAFQYPGLVPVIRDKVEVAWIEPGRLIFEIAESAVTGRPEKSLQTIHAIRALGCKFALRNNGNGFYPLDKVKNFPIDYIKVDGHFTKQLVGEENEPLLLKSMVDVAAKLGITTIFVYVESPTTVGKLREIGVTLAQGYGLGMPESELLEGPSIPFSEYISERNRTQKALREKESYLRVLIDNIPFWVWLKDTQSRFLAINDKLARHLGIDNPESIAGKTDFDFYPPARAERYRLEDSEVLSSRRRKIFEEASADDSSGQRWMEIFVAPVLDEAGEPLGTLGLARDITDRKVAETDLRVAATAFESQEGMVVTDPDTVVLKINHAFTRMTGYMPDEAIGRKLEFFKSKEQNDVFYAEMWGQINRSGNWQGEISSRRKDGECYSEWLSITAVKDDDGGVSHYVGTMVDITERKALEEQMRHIAYHDVLTGLPNRMLLSDRLQQALAQARRENTKLALMYIDLDKFKPVNDNLGHDIGDRLLKEVASRLLTCVKRESDTVSRLGGDEFVVLLSKYQQEADVERVADSILTGLSEPFGIEQHLITISSSIGIATYPAHGQDSNTLMKNADNAMYEAKHAGRSCLKFYACGEF